MQNMTGSSSARVDTPSLRQVVLDCPQPRALAEFYRELIGLQYRPGDETPPQGEPDPRGDDWLCLRDSAGNPCLAFQHVADLPEPTWPDGPRPQMLHLDMTVPTMEDLRTQHARAMSLGARVLPDRTDDEDEPLYVFADPAGHPFCIFVAS